MNSVSECHRTESRRSGGGHVKLALACCAAAVLGLFAVQASTAGATGSWVQVPLGRGKISGYKWGAAAKLPKGSALGSICGQVSITEPPVEEVSEGRDSTICGELNTAGDVVTADSSFGGGSSQVTVTELLYRPLVRSVRIERADGKVSRLYTQQPRIPHRAQQGIPSFRFILLPVTGRACVRRVSAISQDGRVVSVQGFPPC